MTGFSPPPTAPSPHHHHTAPRRSPDGVDDSAGHRLFGGTDHSTDAQQNTRFRGLRRIHTVIGTPSRLLPTLFQGAIDHLRFIWPAPTMPPVTALWEAPATTPADQESPASRRQPTTEHIKNLREAFLTCGRNQQQQAATSTDPLRLRHCCGHRRRPGSALREKVLQGGGRLPGPGRLSSQTVTSVLYSLFYTCPSIPSTSVLCSLFKTSPSIPSTSLLDGLTPCFPNRLAFPSLDFAVSSSEFLGCTLPAWRSPPRTQFPAPDVPPSGVSAKADRLAMFPGALMSTLSSKADVPPQNALVSPSAVVQQLSTGIARGRPCRVWSTIRLASTKFQPS